MITTISDLTPEILKSFDKTLLSEKRRNDLDRLGDIYHCLVDRIRRKGYSTQKKEECAILLNEFLELYEKAIKEIDTEKAKTSKVKGPLYCLETSSKNDQDLYWRLAKKGFSFSSTTKKLKNNDI